MSACLLRHVRRVSLIVIPFCLSVCLDVCRSFRDLQPTTIDRSQPNLVGRYIRTCPRTRVSLFGSPVYHTLSARGKNMQRVFLPLRTWRIVPYDLSVCLSVCALKGKRLELLKLKSVDVYSVKDTWRVLIQRLVTWLLVIPVQCRHGVGVYVDTAAQVL